MKSINILNAIFDAVFYPFRALDPVYGLIAISFLTTLIVLPIFKFASNQKAIKKTKARIIGHLLEVRLFKDNIGLVLNAEMNMFKYNMIYLKHMLWPLLFVFLPAMIIVIHTGVRYEYRPLKPHESVIVKAKLKENVINTINHENRPVLTLTDGLIMEIPPLYVNGGEEIYWRISAKKKGEFEVSLRVLDKEIKRKVFVGDKLTRLSPKIYSGGIIKYFLFPGEPFINDKSGIEFLEVQYPHLEVNLFGWRVHWLVLFFILTLVFGFILLKPFKVSI